MIHTHAPSGSAGRGVVGFSKRDSYAVMRKAGGSNAAGLR
jgi:hypothetical protein